jgi:glycosyltransferase involved in cell wall biosynthesis
VKEDDIKIIGVIDEEPFDFRTWSGISYYLFSSLARKSVLHTAISAEPPKWLTNSYKLLSFHSELTKWKFKYHINTNYYKQMTRSALKKVRKLDQDDYNCILQVGAWYDMTNINGKKTVSYHDGNLSTLLKSPYGYPKVREKYIRRALTYEKELYQKMDIILPMSQWLADSFIRDFEVSARKVIPIGAGINLPYVAEIEAKSYEKPNILFVGRDFKRKGGKQLLEAFNVVRREIKGANLTIIGPHLKDLPEGVKCLGFLPKGSKKGLELLLKEYSSASVYVMPSWYEPFGIVFAEAMAHKLPCIGTNICAMPEIGDTAALTTRLIELLSDQRMCKEMGERAYLKYSENYTWDQVAHKIIEQIRNRR